MSKKEKTCKHDLMPIKGGCLHEKDDPTIADCLDCMVDALYSCLVENKTVQAMDCLHVLVNIHNEVKKLIAPKNTMRRITHREKNIMLAVLLIAASSFEIEKYTGTTINQVIEMMEKQEWDRVNKILEQVNEALKKKIKP